MLRHGMNFPEYIEYNIVTHSQTSPGFQKNYFGKLDIDNSNFDNSCEYVLLRVCALVHFLFSFSIITCNINAVTVSSNKVPWFLSLNTNLHELGGDYLD